MNILFLTSWYPTAEFTYGGVFVREHAKAVRDAGHRVVVLHLAGPRPLPGRSLWVMEEERDAALAEGMETYHAFHRRPPARGASYTLYLRSAIGAHRRLREQGFQPEIIHAHVYGAGVPAAAIGARTRTPVVLTEHFSGFARHTLSRIELRKARYAYARAVRALPVSRHLRDAIRSYGIEARFEVIPNVVDTSLFFPQTHVPSDERGERRLIFVGNLDSDELKGFPTLLTALSTLLERRQDWRLDVVGDGSERVRYEATAAGRGLGERVTFHGSQPKRRVAELMRAADLFVLPSRGETFGTAIVEALASGLPVVSTTAGAIPELVDKHSGALVPPDHPGVLADAIEETLRNIETFDGEAIAAAARDRYSPGVVGERLSRVYESVLDGRENCAVGSYRPDEGKTAVSREQNG